MRLLEPEGVTRSARSAVHEGETKVDLESKGSDWGHMHAGRTHVPRYVVVVSHALIIETLTPINSDMNFVQDTRAHMTQLRRRPKTEEWRHCHCLRLLLLPSATAAVPTPSANSAL
jgi:hypothetical protein